MTIALPTHVVAQREHIGNVTAAQRAAALAMGDRQADVIGADEERYGGDYGAVA